MVRRHRKSRGGSVKDWSPRDVETDIEQWVFEEFLSSYIETALWASNDESDPETGGDPMDVNYNSDDIAPETREEMIRDTEDFVMANIDDIYVGLSRAGHDFWLTRNGAGVGFLDGHWPEPAATRLNDNARAYGEYHLYVGDDGMIYGYEG